MKIIVDKSVIPLLVEQWIRFTIVEDKPIKETPQERIDWFDTFYNWWNEQRKIGSKKWLPKTRNVTQPLKDARSKLYRNIVDKKSSEPVKNALQLVSKWVRNYIEDIKKREDWWYWDHRFTLYEFIKQKNGVQKFLAM